MSIPATNPCQANSAARASVWPWPQPTSSTRDFSSSSRSSSARRFGVAVSSAIMRAITRPRSPVGCADCRAMNSGRCKRFLLFLENDPDSHLRDFVVGGRGRGDISQRITQANPIRDTRADEGNRKPDREVIDSGNTASRNHQAVPEYNRGHDEPEERIEVAQLHGLFLARQGTREWHWVVPTLVQVVVRPSS